MLHFLPVRTARFTFELQELTLGQIRSLYNIPPQFIEKQRTFFLKSALKELKWNKGYENNTIDDLTIQERLFIEAQYLSATSQEPDFELGNANYSSYLLFDKQFSKDNIELGLIEPDTDKSDVWFMRNLSGLQIELIEQRIFTSENPQRIDWILYAMACQMYRNKDITGDDNTEKEPDIYANPIDYSNYLERKVEKFNSLPESVAIELVRMYYNGLYQLTHLFEINFNKDGIILTSDKTTSNDKDEEVAVCGARFCPSTSINPITAQILGKHQAS